MQVQMSPITITPEVQDIMGLTLKRINDLADNLSQANIKPYHIAIEQLEGMLLIYNTLANDHLYLHEDEDDGIWRIESAF